MLDVICVKVRKCKRIDRGEGWPACFVVTCTLSFHQFSIPSQRSSIDRHLVVFFHTRFSLETIGLGSIGSEAGSPALCMNSAHDDWNEILELAGRPGVNRQSNLGNIADAIDVSSCHPNMPGLNH
jgi:hypothetical protein